MNKGSVITYLPFEKYILLVVISTMIGLTLLFYPVWYPKLEDLMFKSNPSNSGITRIGDIYETPEKFDNTIITTEGYAVALTQDKAYAGPYIVSAGYYMILSEDSTYSIFSNLIKTDIISDSQVDYVKSSSCFNSVPIFRITGTVTVSYSSSGLSKSIESVNLSNIYKIEFVKCG